MTIPIMSDALIQGKKEEVIIDHVTPLRCEHLDKNSSMSICHSSTRLFLIVYWDTLEKKK